MPEWNVPIDPINMHFKIEYYNQSCCKTEEGSININIKIQHFHPDWNMTTQKVNDNQTLQLVRQRNITLLDTNNYNKYIYIIECLSPASAGLKALCWIYTVPYSSKNAGWKHFTKIKTQIFKNAIAWITSVQSHHTLLLTTHIERLLTTLSYFQSFLPTKNNTTFENKVYEVK